MSAYRSYDHRVKQMIVKAKDPDLFPTLAIPRSTALSWIRSGVRPVVTIEDIDEDKATLIAKLNALERQLQS